MNPELTRIMTDAKIETMTIGDTLYVFDATTKADVEAKAKRALRRGDEIRRPDGSRSWIETEVVFDPTAEGSDSYTWDASGNRVLHRRLLVEMAPDGNLVKTYLKPVYRAL